MELKKNMVCDTNYGFAKKRNYGYYIIYIITTNYGIEKKRWLVRQIMNLQSKIMMVIK